MNCEHCERKVFIVQHDGEKQIVTEGTFADDVKETSIIINLPDGSKIYLYESFINNSKTFLDNIKTPEMLLKNINKMLVI